MRIGWFALGLSLLAGVFFAIRPLDSKDLGYHLAFGEEMLETGRIVDHAGFVYTLEDRPGGSVFPGSGYNEQGQFVFINANWLSQVLFATVYRTGGAAGLCVLRLVLILGCLVLLAIILLRLKLPPTAVALGVLAAILASYERFLLRPELLTCLLVLAQLSLLLPEIVRREVLPLWRIVAVGGLEILLVNSHSYFLLPIGLVGIGWLDAVGRWVWARWIRPRSERASDLPEETLACLRRLTLCLGILAAATLLNPWSYELAFMPIRTLLYIRSEDIVQDIPTPGSTPLSWIGEMKPTFTVQYFWGVKATWAYLALLCIAAMGILVSCRKKQWILGGMILFAALAGLSMRRNMAISALLVIPPTWLALAGLAKLSFIRRLPSTASRAAIALLAGAVSVALAIWVAGQGFYFHDRLPTRFGWGWSQLQNPNLAAEWINEHDPQGRLWCDNNSSSNLYFLLRPHRPVPIITNTWAWPRDVMQMALDISMGKRDFEPLRRKYGIGVVAIRVDSLSTGLAAYLTDAPRWALVHLDATHAVFVDRHGPNAVLATGAITPETLDLDAYIDRTIAMDPLPAAALHHAGVTLQRIGWFPASIVVFRRALEFNEDYPEVWFELGASYALRSKYHYARGDTESQLENLRQSRRCLLRSLELRPGYEPAREMFGGVTADIQYLSQPRSVYDRP